MKLHRVTGWPFGTECRGGENDDLDFYSMPRHLQRLFGDKLSALYEQEMRESMAHDEAVAEALAMDGLEATLWRVRQSLRMRGDMVRILESLTTDSTEERRQFQHAHGAPLGALSPSLHAADTSTASSPRASSGVVMLTINVPGMMMHHQQQQQMRGVPATPLLSARPESEEREAAPSPMMPDEPQQAPRGATHEVLNMIVYAYSCELVGEEEQEEEAREQEEEEDRHRRAAAGPRWCNLGPWSHIVDAMRVDLFCPEDASSSSSPPTSSSDERAALPPSLPALRHAAEAASSSLGPRSGDRIWDIDQVEFELRDNEEDGVFCMRDEQVETLRKFLASSRAEQVRFTAYVHDRDGNVCEVMNTGMINVHDMLEEDADAHPDSDTRDVVLDFGVDDGILYMSFAEANRRSIAARAAQLQRLEIALPQVVATASSSSSSSASGGGGIAGAGLRRGRG